MLGPPEHGATRINIAQTFNGVGWILGPIVGGYFVFAGNDGANAHAGLSTPYLGIGIFAAVWFLVFIFAPVPDLLAEDESRKPADQKTSLKPTGGQLAGISIALVVVWGLLYFFIAPIMGLLWTLLNLPANVLDPTKYGLIIVAYIGSFVVVSKNWDMFRRKHFTLGVVAQFLYVAAQTGIFSFCVNYIIENDADVTPAKAATMLGGIGFVLFTLGRICGSAVISQFKPHLVLAVYAAINVVLAAVCMGGGKLGLFALFGTFFFMSIMFPTIFALGIRGLGDHTKLGSSLIVMSIVGGAIAPPRMGHIADVYSMRLGMVVPLVCFVFIAIYGAIWQMLEAKDAAK